MTVTEFALIRLREDGRTDLEFLEMLMQCQETQDGWVHRNQPHLREAGTNLSSMFLQEQKPGDEPHLLITAPWDSPEGHHRWLECKENRRSMAKLAERIAPGDDSVVLFHMDPAGSNPNVLLGDRVSREPFRVCRLSVPAGERAALQAEFLRLERELAAVAEDGQLWAGWRIERPDDDGGREDLVVFWDPNIRSKKLGAFLDRYPDKDIRAFRNIV